MRSIRCRGAGGNQRFLCRLPRGSGGVEMSFGTVTRLRLRIGDDNEFSDTGDSSRRLDDLARGGADAPLKN